MKLGRLFAIEKERHHVVECYDLDLVHGPRSNVELVELRDGQDGCPVERSPRHCVVAVGINCDDVKVVERIAPEYKPGV